MLGIPIVDKIIALINVLAVSVVVGFFAYSNFIAKTPPIDEQIEEMLLEKSAMINNESKSYKVDKLIINLQSRSTRLRFLDTEVNLEPFSVADLEYFAQAVPKAIIYDTIIDLVSQMKPQELTSLSGKIILGSRIKNHLNQAFRQKKIKRVFFSTFVVQ